MLLLDISLEPRIPRHEDQVEANLAPRRESLFVLLGKVGVPLVAVAHFLPSERFGHELLDFSLSLLVAILCLQVRQPGEFRCEFGQLMHWEVRIFKRYPSLSAIV